jgi:hypothetical protein
MNSIADFCTFLTRVGMSPKLPIIRLSENLHSGFQIVTWRADGWMDRLRYGEYNWPIFSLCVASVSSSQYLTVTNSGSCLKDSCDWEKINQLLQERTPSRVIAKPSAVYCSWCCMYRRNERFCSPSERGL